MNIFYVTIIFNFSLFVGTHHLLDLNDSFHFHRIQIWISFHLNESHFSARLFITSDRQTHMLFRLDQQFLIFFIFAQNDNFGSVWQGIVLEDVEAWSHLTQLALRTFILLSHLTFIFDFFIFCLVKAKQIHG